MSPPVDLYESYGRFDAEVLARVRHKAFGEDFGQNSWTTDDEYRRWAEWLNLNDRSHVLEVATGSGGPAIFLAELFRGRVTGVDINVPAIATATQRARARGLADRVVFQVVDADRPLPFGDDSVDAILCVDAANHLLDRPGMLKEWHRVLAPGGRALFTDPVVVTGPVTNDELAARSSIGPFLFVPPGVNERLIEQAGFELDRREDVTENAAQVSKRWHDARAEDRDALVTIEGDEHYAGLQAFFLAVHRLTSERRLSRIAYLAKKLERS